MSKRFMCLVLSFVMILSMVSVTGYAADFKQEQGKYEASYVEFSIDGDNLKAEITVKEEDTGSKSAVFWLGAYDANGVLVASDFEKHTFEAEKIFEASVPTNSGTTFKAYIWEDVFCGKAIAPVATYPSSSTEIYFAEKDGDKWDAFSNDTFSYTLKYNTAEGIPVIELFPKDNSTQIIEPESYITGENDIRVVAADGKTEKTFTVTCIPEEPADVYGGEKTLDLESNTDNKVSVTSNNAGNFGKPSWDKTYKVSSSAASASARIKPYVYETTLHNKNVYISFDVAFTSASDAIYFMSNVLKADGTKDGTRNMTFGPAGMTSAYGWKGKTGITNIPEFKLNQWYNIAITQPADGTSTARIFINGVEYKSTGAWYSNYGVYDYRIQIAGGPSSGFYIDNYFLNKDGLYDPTVHQISALTVKNTTDVGLDGTTLIVPKEYTASQLISALNLGANSASIYSDKTYATRVTGTGALSTGNVLVLTNGNGSYRYYSIKCKTAYTYDGSTSIGSFDATSNINGYSSNVASKFGKSASDVAYELEYVASDNSETVLTKIEEKENATYVAADVVFTSDDEAINFKLVPYTSDSSDVATGAVEVSLKASGATGVGGTSITGTVPAFEKNKWYNVALSNNANGTGNYAYLYVNGVAYKLTNSAIAASYGTYSMEVAAVGNSGKLYLDNLSLEENAEGANAYNFADYQLAPDFSKVTNASLSGNTLGLTAGTLVSAIETAFPTLAVSAYSDATFATKLDSSASLTTGNVVVISNAVGAFRYYTVKVALVETVSSGAIYDGKEAFASYTHTNSKAENNHVITITSGVSSVSSVFGKFYVDDKNYDKVYRIDADTTNATKSATLVKANGAKDPAYISFDIAFTGPNSSIRFFRQGYKEEAMSSDEGGTSTYFDLTPAGVSNNSHISKMDTVPAFNLNEWYNIAFVMPETTGTAGILYVNGVAYNITYDATLYGAYRFRVDVYDGYEDTFYLDNIMSDKKATGDYAYAPSLEEKPEVGSNNTDIVQIEEDTIKVKEETTLGEVLAALTIDASYDASVRAYTDSTFALPIESDYMLEEGNVIVIAATYGYTIERAYAYYTIVVE